MNMFLCPKELFADGEEKITYDSPTFPLYFRRGQISNFLHRRALPHFHADFEYIRILTGELGYEVNGKRYVLKKGEGIFINSKALHYGYGIDEKECDFLCLIFPGYLLSSCPEIEEKFLFPYLVRDSALFLKNDSEAIKIIDQLWKEKNGEQNPLSYSSLIFSLWEMTIPLFSAKGTTPSNSSLTLVKNALAYLRIHYSETISLPGFAKALAVSPSLLTKLFRNYLHDSPMNYLSGYRLRIASERLVESDDSIKSLSDQVGYSSANFFARSFKKKFGVSPKEYRKIKSKKHEDNTQSLL